MANVVGFKVDLFSHMCIVISGCWFENRCCSVTAMDKRLSLLIIGFPRGKKVSGLYQVSDQVGGPRALQLVLASGCTLSPTLFAAVTTPE